jgi:hypothetical protein
MMARREAVAGSPTPTPVPARAGRLERRAVDSSGAAPHREPHDQHHARGDDEDALRPQLAVRLDELGTEAIDGPSGDVGGRDPIGNRVDGAGKAFPGGFDVGFQLCWALWAPVGLERNTADLGARHRQARPFTDRAVRWRT